jgi:hypothetical protein
MSQKEREKINVGHIRAITFGLKVIEEILHQFCLEKSNEEIHEFILASIDLIVEITSLSCEQSEQVIKNQSQILFHLIMN